MFSDFGAHPGGARPDVLSFLITNDTHWRNWDAVRSRWRSENLPDQRRLKYSSLGDRKRAGALSAFLSMADHLPGLLATFVVHPASESLFTESGRLRPSDLGWGDDFPVKMKVTERILRCSNALAPLVAGLTDESQDVLWICDDDDIVANDALSNVTSAAFGAALEELGRSQRVLCIPVSTPGLDRIAAEDSCSLTDLAAGALVEVFRGNATPITATQGTFTPASSEWPEKAKAITVWLSARDQPLKRLICGITADGPEVEVSQLRFGAGSSPSMPNA